MSIEKGVAFALWGLLSAKFFVVGVRAIQVHNKGGGT